jgi:hypothetical protein
MFEYEMEMIPTGGEDSCLKIYVGLYEVSVAFDVGSPARIPSDIRVFTKVTKGSGMERIDITEQVLGDYYVQVNSLADVIDAIKKVEDKKR